MPPNVLNEGWDDQTALLWFALVIEPLLAGVIAGGLLRWATRGRLRGLLAFTVMLALPTAALTVLALRQPGIGTWDGACEGLLTGLGLCISAHRAFARPRAVLVSAGTFIAGLLVLEGLSRLVLPPAPGFPSGTPHLFLNAAFRQNEPIFAGAEDQVCTIAYPGTYHSRYNVDPSAALPERRSGRDPVTNPTQRVLHLGDSMAYGFGVGPDETFEAVLEGLEPRTEHLNASIIGTGPDDYLIVLRRWIAQARFDRAVMYLYEGNDLSEVDKGHQCSGWRSILTYGPRGATLRYPDGPHEAHALWEHTRSTSPPPFVVRALVHRSKVAALLAAAMCSLQTPDVNAVEPDSARWAHLAVILRSARDDLRARGIPLVVVVLPLRSEVEHQRTGAMAQHLMDTARREGIPVLDPGGLIRAAVARSEVLFPADPYDGHFNPAGHRLLARWLHEQLPLAVETAAPVRTPPP